MHRNILLTISYDGSGYYGWQKQKDKKTVQGTLEDFISGLFCEKIRLIGAGRTDSGAHAVRYIANFETNTKKPNTNKLKYIINRSIDSSIRILDAKDVSDDFHSQYSSFAREYIYSVISEGDVLPFYRDYHCITNENFDIDRLNEAAKLFVGEHNFEHFCYGYQKNEKDNFVRRVFYFRVAKRPLGRNWNYLFFIKGEGFLRGMIRTLVSVCISYSKGLIDKSNISNTFTGKNDIPVKYKAPVPACGLYFKRAYFNIP